MSDKLAFVRQRCSLCEAGTAPKSRPFFKLYMDTNRKTTDKTMKRFSAAKGINRNFRSQHISRFWIQKSAGIRGLCRINTKNLPSVKRSGRYSLTQADGNDSRVCIHLSADNRKPSGSQVIKYFSIFAYSTISENNVRHPNHKQFRR